MPRLPVIRGDLCIALERCRQTHNKHVSIHKTAIIILWKNWQWLLQIALISFSLNLLFYLLLAVPRRPPSPYLCPRCLGSPLVVQILNFAGNSPNNDNNSIQLGKEDQLWWGMPNDDIKKLPLIYQIRSRSTDPGECEEVTREDIPVLLP